MHIPDGFLDVKTTAATAALSVAALGIALRHTGATLPPKRVPLMGLAAAFIFAAQMLNFPVAGGTSGHLAGGTLAAVLLGPSAAVVVLAAVLIVQCLMFADGGLLALGANVFNLGVVHPLVGYALYRAVRRVSPGEFGRILGVTFAAWAATVVTAIVCAGELAASGRAAWSVAFTAMTSVHMLIGVGEAAITATVVATVARTRPELLDGVQLRGFDVVPVSSPVGTEAAGGAAPAKRRSGYLAFTAYGLLAALGLALFVAPFASSLPDGLEYVAEKVGFIETAKDNPLPAPMPDYQWERLDNAAVATAFAGAAGTLVMFGVAYGFARVLTRKPTPQEVETPVAG